MEPHEDAYGQAMLDHFHGKDAWEIIEREDGFFSIGAGPELYFSEFEDWRTVEQQAMGFVRGRVLDVGCGAGRVMLYLRDKGYDVEAASEDPVLAESSDQELLRFAAGEGRVVVTENVKDFDRIVRSWAAAGEHHQGVIFTSPRRYHRGSAGYPANLVAALRHLLDDPPPSTTDWIHWLP
jgi:SAM-dependent methyltransferase